MELKLIEIGPGVIGAAIGWFWLWFIPLTMFFGLVYYLTTLPVRRQERARFFLDLLETGFRAGQSAEQTLVAIARSRDTNVGPRFHLVAAYVQSGHRLVDALEKVPSLLPPQLVAMLAVGAQAGEVARILPACRRLLRDAGSRLQSAINYQIIVLFTFNPLVLALPFGLTGAMTTLSEVFGGFGTRPPAPFLFAARFATWLLGLQWFIIAGLLLAAGLYIGGPRLLSWVQAGFFPASDWVCYWIPWRRKRLQRDFTSMLAILLDAEVPEARALALAAESTANRVFVARAERVTRALEQGEPLTEAVQKIDETGELRWRLSNANHAQRGFLEALEGWHEALDAKAFQQEQAYAHALSTLLVLVNAAVVGLFAAGILQAISALGTAAFGR